MNGSTSIFKLTEHYLYRDYQLPWLSKLLLISWHDCHFLSLQQFFSLDIPVLYVFSMDESQCENEWKSHGRYRLYWPQPAATQKAAPTENLNSSCRILFRTQRYSRARPVTTTPSHPALLANRCCRGLYPASFVWKHPTRGSGLILLTTQHSDKIQA